MFYCLPVFAADDAQVVSSFKQYVSDILTQVNATYEGNNYRIAYIPLDAVTKRPGYWIKIKRTIDPTYNIDVQKSNSLISPYIGTLEVNTTNVFYKGYPNQQDAEATDAIDHTTGDNYKFTIAFQDEKWVVTDSKEFSTLLGKWFATDSKDIFQNLKCPYPKH